MGTALLYIAVGYYLGRRLLYAPMPRAAFAEAMEMPTQAEQLEAVVEAPDEAALPPPEPAAAPIEEPFVAEQDLPPQWLSVLSNPNDCKSFVEASVQVLRLDVGKYRDRLVTIDGEVRQCVRTPNA